MDIELSNLAAKKVRDKIKNGSWFGATNYKEEYYLFEHVDLDTGLIHVSFGSNGRGDFWLFDRGINRCMHFDSGCKYPSRKLDYIMVESERENLVYFCDMELRDETSISLNDEYKIIGKNIIWWWGKEDHFRGGIIRFDNREGRFCDTSASDSQVREIIETANGLEERLEEFYIVHS